MELPHPSLEVLHLSLEVLHPSLEVPHLSLELPDFSLAFPDFSVEVPDYTVEVPDYTVEVPDYTVEVSDYAVEVPDYTVEVPDFSVEVPQNAVQAPHEGGGSGAEHCLPAMDGCVENCSRVLRQQNSMLKIYTDVDFKHRWGYGADLRSRAATRGRARPLLKKHLRRLEKIGKKAYCVVCFTAIRAP